MNILITANEKYLYPASVMMRSVIENNRDCKIVFYFMYHDICKDSRKKLKYIADRHHLCSIEFIYVDKNLFADVPLEAEINSYITVETYFRLAVAELLPLDIDRILYLDTDIIVNGPLKRLYCKKFEKGTAALACDDIGLYMNQKIGKKVFFNLGFKPEEHYFNAGVMLINLNEFRKNYSLQIFMNYISTRKNKLIFHDQDVLNALLKNKVKFISYKQFNLRPFYLPYSKKSVRKLNHALIIHYGEKPWEENFSDMGGEIFQKYAQLDSGIQKYELLKNKNNAFQGKKKYIYYNEETDR